MDGLRVLVVDDHTLVRQGIVGLLEGQPDVTVVGQAGNGHEALDAVAALQPDVVLMDVSMPELGGLAATREIRTRWPGVRVVILTIHDREDYLYEAIRVGASGYVLKDADVGELLRALRTAANGEVYLHPGATRALIDEYRRMVAGKAEADPYTTLSDREREVLALIAQGRTTTEIAGQLFLSPHTVQSHREHLMTKLGLHSKTELIKYAIAKGLIEL